jgi:hypothetical protein
MGEIGDSGKQAGFDPPPQPSAGARRTHFGRLTWRNKSATIQTRACC